jgi:hypothetical protein
MSGTWQGLTNQPPFTTSTMILLTDGRVMVQEEATAHWHALTPDAFGSYVNGTWSSLADMSFWRRYYASAVLRDGRVIVIGGEQSGGGGDTNQGEIYDPVSNGWTPIPSPPGWATVGDAVCCLFPDGRFMIGALGTPDCTIYDPVTDSWTAAAAKAVRSNEETWILLPDESILTVQCWDPWRSERYSISSNAWKDEGPLPIPLVDPVMHEIGPAMLLYDGRVIYFGAANVKNRGRTVIYTPPPTQSGTGTWVRGPDLPLVGRRPLVCNDCPASLMPNGKVLVASAPWVFNDWGSPISILEYDPFLNTITVAPTPPNNGQQLYWSRMMLLPTGQVLFGPSLNDVRCYTPDGAPREAWRPTIWEVVPHCVNGAIDYYLLRGTQLTGFSQACVYGDDCNPATNYPLVRLRSTASGRVYYCRTWDFSSRGVASGTVPESVRFDASHVPYGDYELCVVANGISSHCIAFCHRRVESAQGNAAGCGCGKRECSCCCETLCCEQERIDPLIFRLFSHLDTLQQSVSHLQSQGRAAPGPLEPKERRQATRADKQAAERLAAPDKPASRRAPSKKPA